MNRLKVKKTKTKINNMKGAGGAPAMDLQSLTESDIQALMDQGILPEQIAEIAAEQGQPVPPIIQAMLQQSSQGPPPPGMEQGPPPGMEQGPPPGMEQGPPPGMEQGPPPGMEQGPPPGMEQGPPPGPGPTKASQFPSMMDVTTYGKYKEVEKKTRIGAHKPNVFGYQFSDLISEEILRDMKRTQGSFLVGVSLSNLFNEFTNMVATDDQKAKKQGIMTPLGKKDSEEIFKRTGEWIDVDYDKILDKKMGFRGSDLPLLPEKVLTDYSTFYEVIDESKKYANQSGYNGKITPYGLLVMTRMLFRYKKSNAQWLRVATILELIFKYLGTNQNRDFFFKSNIEIPIMSLMDLEEYYNTDHIFMTEKELSKFKKDLKFYKYDRKVDIKMKINELRKKIPPI
jgi:hypothetical protein